MLFTYLFFKNIPPTDFFTDLLKALLVARPYLALSFAISPVIMCLFTCAGVVGIINITRISETGTYQYSSISQYLPAIFSTGMGLTFLLVEIIPMRINFHMIKKISLIHEICLMLLPLVPRSGGDRGNPPTELDVLADSLANAFRRRPAAQFFEGICMRGNAMEPLSGTRESCEVLVYEQHPLSPAPPPDYWQSGTPVRETTVADAVRTVFSQMGHSSTICFSEHSLHRPEARTTNENPPVYQISGNLEVAAVQSGELPPLYSSVDDFLRTVEVTLVDDNRSNLGGVS